MTRTASAFGLWIAVASIAGCGPDARRLRADETVHAAAAALTDVQETSGGEEATREPLERSRHWLEQSEAGIDVWGSSGSLAYETSVACLATALGALRDAIVAAGRPPPDTLEEAEALAHEATDHRCAERRDLSEE